MWLQSLIGKAASQQAATIPNNCVCLSICGNSAAPLSKISGQPFLEIRMEKRQVCDSATDQTSELLCG